MIDRSWLEVSLKTLSDNYRILMSHLPNHVEIMMAVKADAYGQGDIPVAKTLEKLGCKHFAVSNLEEALHLRENGISGEILILGYTSPDRWQELKQYDITQTLICEEYAQSMAGHGIKAQYAIDTGMNRIGLDGNNPSACEAAIRKAAFQYELTGIFTHLACADMQGEEAFTDQQISVFQTIVESVSDLKLPYFHCMNSAAALYHKPYGNIARFGIAMYGLNPGGQAEFPKGIQPIMRWKTVVAMVKTLHPGESVSYGCTFTAQREMKVATLPTGYADGYSRHFSGKGGVLLHGKIAPVLGRVCMDQMMVDVSEIPQARAGDTVLLMGPELSPDLIAVQAGTISDEIICMVSKRVPRVYIDCE